MHHAERKYGQKLVTDPLRPPYGYADPAWPMRLTQGHSAVLVDGRGHEHHNGVEGTNASRSYARITTTEKIGLRSSWSILLDQNLHLTQYLQLFFIL